MSSTEVVVADKDERRAKDLVKKIGTDNVSWTQSDVANQDKLTKTLREFDLVMGFLPGNLGYSLAEACIATHKDLVDVSYVPQDLMQLNQAALKAGSTIIPDCGLAPGISNVLVGHSAATLDKIKAVHMMVGGLPEKPVPPLGYVITWSPESLIDEYTRKAVIVRNGHVVEVEALSGVEQIEFPKVGKLEAFYTDGLRTLLHTFKDVRDMWEKTLRYPGHAEKMKLLKVLGFFSETNVTIEGSDIQPRKFTAKILQQKLSSKRQKDIVVLKVETIGTKNKEETIHTYDLLDFCDEKRKITAMARTTSYPASIVAQLVLMKALKEKGVVPPERIGMDNKLFKLFSEGMKSRGININEEKTAA